ncbi:hypothetical protein [Nocardiopsis suaedae]|uniref:DUF397 domain-containing protein n=1 Tax=Nocardiopsis suaedae TaxID=3018444 RepID=A0ABT4TIN9_9ACTN|nr:hypothetical protein [Nocardiopsis suaedae]MDA2804568.1 hypothetical protein [Nocardiopsis suaedae]
MPIKPTTCYRVTCFGCGVPMTDDYTTLDGSFIHFTSVQEAFDAVAKGEFEWGLDGPDGRQPHCPDCLPLPPDPRAPQHAAHITADPLPR